MELLEYQKLSFSIFLVLKVLMLEFLSQVLLKMQQPYYVREHVLKHTSFALLTLMISFDWSLKCNLEVLFLTRMVVFMFVTFLKCYQYFNKTKEHTMHCVKSVRIRSYSGPHFPAFGLNTYLYCVSLRIQSECGKMRTRITPNTDTWLFTQQCSLMMPGFMHS